MKVIFCLKWGIKMRELKFRAWHKTDKIFCDGTTSNMFDWIDEGQDIELMQYTGLKDANGQEIYDEDIIRINIVDGNYREYKFDGIYEVKFDLRGVSFKFIKLAWEYLDFNAYPMREMITSNYIYSQFEEIISGFYSELSNGKEIKSTSIKIIGNKHENPELLINKKE
jgi:uncharacterized phage protein (TIGR01671 family)